MCIISTNNRYTLYNIDINNSLHNIMNYYNLNASSFNDEAHYYILYTINLNLTKITYIINYDFLG